jgi:hypothetical protein
MEPADKGFYAAISKPHWNSGEEQEIVSSRAQLSG